MGRTVDVNNKLIHKYRVDYTILESYFKNSSNQDVSGVVFPKRIDNRQYCSPTDYQGDKPSCCGYSAAQILEALSWKDTGKLVQFDADQIYAKAKEQDGRLGGAGTYPDLAMTKGLVLVPGWRDRYCVKTSTSGNIDELKRAIHKNMFVSVNMVVTKDIYDLSDNDFVYTGSGEKAGGHSLVCCGYDDESKMLILQNHWGTIWGLKGFFLCPYDVWAKQCNLFCWYERIETPVPAKKEVKEVVVETKKSEEPPKVEEPKPKKEEPKVEEPKKEEEAEAKPTEGK